jgi:hypothetical protein
MIRLLAALLAVVVAAETPAQIVGMPPPVKARRFGWAGPEAAKAARVALGDAFPAELGKGGESLVAADEIKAAGGVVYLWDFTRDRNNGAHWAALKQLIGDCTSWGYSHGVLMTLAVHQVLTGSDDPLEAPFPPYGYSRVQIVKGRFRGDGSVGAWCAAAAKEGGYVTWKQAGVPYSAAIAREWGRKGPPAALIEIGKRSPADVRLIRTFDEAASAIATGHAVPVCSGVGFEKIVERNGRVEGVAKGNWPHCMCFIGVDVRPGREALYCWNSWGPDAHAPEESYARLDGAPPGGFWVTKTDAERMLKEEDSFALSFSGFKALPLWRRQQAKEGLDCEPLSILEYRRRARAGDLLSALHGRGRAEYRLAP